MHVLGDLLGGRDDVRDVRVPRLIERCRDTQQDRRRLLDGGVVGGREDVPVLYERGEHLGRDVLDVRTTSAELGDSFRVYVNTVHLESGLGEFDHERQTYVAEPDDGDGHVAPSKSLFEFHGISGNRT